jgi:hypothetical protein
MRNVRAYKILSEVLKGEPPRKVLGVDRWIILKYVGRMWAGFMWFRIGTIGSLL